MNDTQKLLMNLVSQAEAGGFRAVSVLNGAIRCARDLGLKDEIHMLTAAQESASRVVDITSRRLHELKKRFGDGSESQG